VDGEDLGYLEAPVTLPAGVVVAEDLEALDLGDQAVAPVSLAREADLNPSQAALPASSSRFRSPHCS
jgi:hypothetical protein